MWFRADFARATRVGNPMYRMTRSATNQQVEIGLPFSSVIGSIIEVSRAFKGIAGTDIAITGRSRVRCKVLPLASVTRTVTL
jgi:hypothetical protein